MKAVSVLEHFSDHGSIHQKMKKNTTSVRSYPNSAGDAVMFPVNSNSTPKKLLQNLSEYFKQIVSQWIPGHCGNELVTGQELAHHLAKKGASIPQPTKKAIPFTSANLKLFPCGQDVKQLPSIVRPLDTALLKRHHRIHVAQTTFCTLCDIWDDMVADHIRHCPALDSSLCDLYWQSRELLGS
ncbi:hypothetical protein TNCV_3191171 [Trichonephila clavipes]|nr:hypothetical protein TNCV_3191171 [Trichonephila clavipes]